MDHNCLFCKIIKGDLPSSKVYEDEKVLAFKDINPAAPIHILLIPKKHISSLADVKEEDGELISYMHKMVNVIAKQEGFDKNGYRLIVNCGKDAGQEVMHLHFHILSGKKLGDKIV